MTPSRFTGAHGIKVIVYARGADALAAARRAHGMGQVTRAKRTDGRIKGSAKTIPDIRLAVPTLAQMAANFSTALAAQIAAGCPIVTAAIFQERWGKCEACRDAKGQRIFDPAGWGGRGKCRLCGCCAQLKLAWATAACKRGLW